MESVDALFGADIINEIDKKTPDGGPILDAFGNPVSEEEDDNIVMFDEDSLAELFEGSTPFDDTFPARELGNSGDDAPDFSQGLSGIGEAEDDGDGVPIPEEARGKKKKDKRTARSQAHAKKKAQAAAQPDVRDSGIFAEDEEFGDGAGLGSAEEFNSVIDTRLIDDDDGEEIILEPASRKSKKNKSAQGASEKKRKGAAISYDDEWNDEDDYEQVEVDLPDWADSIRRKVNANVAHAFLLNGNVRDYMVRNISIKDGIVAVLDGTYENFDIIAEYDQAHGISFYGDDIFVREGRTLADAYKERFIEEMQEAQERLSIPQTQEIPNRDPVTLFAILSDMFDRPSKTRSAKILLFIDYSDLLVPDASSAQMKPDERKLAITLADIGRSQAADDAGNVLIFITDDMTQLSTRIRSAESRIEQVKIPIPDRAERADFIDNVLDVPENILSDGTQIFEHEDSISKDAFAINSAGLSRIQIEDIMLRALSEDEPLSMQLMKERKQEIIREDYDDVLEIIDPKTGFERIGGMALLKETFQEEIIEPVHAGEHEAVPMGVLLAGAPGTAKSIHENSLVLTEKGFVEAKDIYIGDKLYGDDGKLYEVDIVAPQPMQTIYRVHLTDHTFVDCSADHHWIVQRQTRAWLRNGQWWEDLTTREMYDIIEERKKKGQYAKSFFRLPPVQPLKMPSQDLPIDPYLLGCLLGDGTITSKKLGFTSEDDDIIENLRNILERDHNLTFVIRSTKNKTKRLDIRCLHHGEHSLKEFRRLLAELGLLDTKSSTKFVPDCYKWASVEQRHALLCGLMDTDGSTCVCGGQCYEYHTTSKRLMEDVDFIASSLGYIFVDAGSHANYYNGKRGKDVYRARFTTNAILPRAHRSEKKEKNWHEKEKKDGLRIKTIEILDQKAPMVCFRVTNPNHTFLVNHFTPTRNTMFSKAVAKEAGMNFVALNLNRIMEKWVGSTERNLDRALDCALAMAPTIIFIDEIDEALPNRADPNASSVNKRINQRLLTFFSDTSHRGEVIILAATNYPEKIDPAFKRAGRFDMRIPMFAPDEFDRMRIMRAIAKGRGYSFSWFEDPDDMVENPFKNLKEWIYAGNVPQSDDRHFVGDREMYSYTVKDALGNDERHDVYIPVRTIKIIDKEKISLQQLYENVRILMPDLPVRQPDASTGEIDTDEVYQQHIMDYIRSRTDLLGYDERNMKNLLVRIWKWEQIYSTFVDQTFRMTGAEMDVIMNKAINLYKKWKRRIGPEKVQQAIAARVMKDDHDIPWSPFLLDACRKTVSASSGIKEMEDMALINTSDTDFIPDAMYGQLDDGRVISYRTRHEELITRQEKSTLGKDRNKN